jgi:hypothetical protein
MAQYVSYCVILALAIQTNLKRLIYPSESTPKCFKRFLRGIVKIGGWRYHPTIMGDVSLSFGDNVRIRSTPLTEKLGLAGQTGCIYGETRPSVTGVEVIGEVTDDYAVNVMIEARREQLWFAPDLVEFIDHGAGTEVRIGNKHLVRDVSGEWSEVSGSNPPLKLGFIYRLMRSFRGRR